MLGQIIGNYKITAELAKGGMGAVYRGRHQNLPREVVVKSILLSSFPLHAQEHLKARFVREAYVQSQLDHQNIVRVYEFFTTPENYYLVMEFIDGMSLRDLIIRQGALAPASAVPLFKQALSALGYAHNFNYVDESGNRHTGIIHRDIKPANMLLGGTGQLKITDFGIVKLAGESSLTKTGFNPGTVEYMSPEQIRGLEVDARSDLYSLGVTFYELITGRLPFPPSDTGSEYEVLRGHIEVPPPPITTVKPDVPEALGAVIMRSLHKDPAARFQSAAEFLDALTACEQSGVLAAGRVTAKPPQATHSMTEVISYDTRPDPATQSGATLPIDAPRPIQKPDPATLPGGTLPMERQDLATAPIDAPRPVQQQPIRQQAVQQQPIQQQPAQQRPIQQQPMQQPPAQQAPQAPQVYDPAPVNRQATKPSGKKSGGYGLIIAVATVVLLAVAGGAFVLFKPGGVIATMGLTPTPSVTPVASTTPSNATPTPAVTQVDVLLARAQMAEATESYRDAIDLYNQYLAANPSDPKASEIKAQVEKLRKFFGLYTAGVLETNMGDHKAAAHNYEDALKVLPDSKMAQDALKKAQSQK